MKKYFKLLGIAFMATSLCVAMASCNKDKDNDESDTPDSGIATAGYVDLGLPSGTKWKADNEANPNDENDFYTYDKALAAFGNQLPTKEQFQELIDNCLWSWNDTKKGYDIRNNGNTIFLPAAGDSDCDGNVQCVGSRGGYWSSMPDDSEEAWYLFIPFSSGDARINNRPRCNGLSVRLVHN